MGRTGIILSLLVVGLALAHIEARHSSNERENESLKPQPFRSGYEYVFQYNGQIALGLVDPNTIGQQISGEIEAQQQQKAATRVQTQVKINFNNDRHATLRLEQIQIGQVNTHIENAQYVQPMGMFERKHIDEAKLRELQLPCEFSYVDGVVMRVQFHPEDKVWSKNIKRAVLNMIQLNMKPVNEQNGENLMSENDKLYTAKAYSVPEITVEGDCQSTYTINSNSNSLRVRSEFTEEEQNKPIRFNVTKSIDFKQCKQIADVAFGFQSQPDQLPQCAQCMQQQWLNSKNQDQQQNNEEDFYYQNPCAQLCDSKEIKEQTLERSTVMRVECVGRPEQSFGIKRAELVSHYVYKTVGAESIAPESKQPTSAMHAIVACELRLIGEKQSSGSRSNVELKEPSKRDETLLYDNEFDAEEKRFYMYGDEEFGRHTPFRAVQNKVENVLAIFRRILDAASDKINGIESEVASQLPRLIETLRMCSVDELEQIVKSLIQQKQQSEVEKEKTKQIVADTLALAGTRNTIAILVKYIQNNEILVAKSIHAISSLRSLPAPSDSIVEIVHQLIKSEQCRRSPSLKQSALLTLGTLISEVCRYKAQYPAQRRIFETQSGFDKEEICPRNKKEAYKQALTEQFEQAETIYEKVLVLKAFGNAGLDIAVSSPLEAVIRGELFANQKNEITENESVVLRIHAIDALRRLVNQMPRKIQRLLLPIYQNNRERPEVRMSAFSILMLTNPEHPIVDQIVYSLTKERSTDVRAFVYAAMKVLSQSVVPSEQELARYLKTALKMVKIDEAVVSSSFTRFPFTSGSQEGQQQNGQSVEAIILQLASIYRSSQNQMLPTHISAAVHTIFNEQLQLDSIQVSATQINLNRWAENLMNIVLQMANRQMLKSASPTRAERENVQYNQEAEQELRGVFSELKIKRRSFNKDSGLPFGMICVRIGDVDKIIFPLNEQTVPEAVQMILNGERPTLSSLGQLKSLNGAKKFYRILSTMSLNEKFASIPTTLGLPLRILHTQPILASVDGEAKINVDTGALFTAKSLIDAYTGVSAVEVRKMEVRVETILAVGVESMRAVEAHLPLKAELQYNVKQGLKLAVQTPKAPKTRLFGLHTLAITYTREFDSKTHMFREPKIKAVHAPHLEPYQVSVNNVFGEQKFGMPLRVHGHYYLPSKSSSQSLLDYIVDLARISLCSENHLHITFEPTQGTPRELEFHLNGAIFETLQSGQQSTHSPSQQLRNFYEGASNQFERAYPEDSNENTEIFNEKRGEQFNNFVKKFDQTKMYKHSLKLSAQTIGGRKQLKAEAELNGVCDARLKYCKLGAVVKRTPMLESETEWWTLKANAELVAPETVSSPAELDSLKSLKNQKLVARCQCEWGCAKKQRVSFRLQGENSNVKQLKKLIASVVDEQDQLKIRRELAFLNKFDVAAKYQLDASTQNVFARIMEVLKCYKPWNTESQLLTGVSGQLLQQTTAQCSMGGQDCDFHANVVIDSINQRYVNISMRTILQAVRMTSIPLPFRLRPFLLIRAQDKPTHSAFQIFTRFASESRAECVVDGRRVETFDGVEYAAPINKCYSVLAKDCGNEETKFSVLMKSLDEFGKQKKIKVLTRNEVIECEPKKSTEDGDYKKLTCKINGQEITQENQVEQRQETVVEYNNDEQTSVDINLEGVRVRFSCLCSDCKCQKATVKLAEQYKHLQCGICGHYDESTRDEFRMSNNEQTEDLTVFHRSYSLNDNEECTAQKQNDFYSAKRNQFGQMSRPLDSEEDWEQNWQNENKKFLSENVEEENQWKDGGYASNDDASSSESASNEWNNWNDEVDKENTNDFFGKSINNGKQSERKQKKYRSQNQQSRLEEPKLQTIVTEYNHRICFSTQPMKQCVKNSRPTTNADNQNESDEVSGVVEKVKMQFVCLKRSDVEARRMQREARRGVIIDVSNYSPNYEQKITPVQMCINY